MNIEVPRFGAWETLPQALLQVEVWNEGRQRASAPHAHVQGQLFGAFVGLITLGTETGHWAVPAAHAVWIPPRISHHVLSHGNYYGWSAYVDVAAGSELPCAPRIVRTTGLLREAVLRLADNADRTSPLVRRRIAQVALDEVARLPHVPFGLPLPIHPRLVRVAQEILSRPADARDVNAWAEQAAMSTRTLLRRFVAETGFGFEEWRQRARVLHAMEKLAAGLSVNRVALDVGYQNPSAFIAMFKRCIGRTPRQLFPELKKRRGAE